MNFKKKENKLPPYKAPARTIKNKISSPSIDCQTKMPRYGSVIDCENAYNFQTLLQYKASSKTLNTKPKSSISPETQFSLSGSESDCEPEKKTSNKQSSHLSDRTNKNLISNRDFYGNENLSGDDDDFIKKFEQTRSTLLERTNNLVNIDKKKNIFSETSNKKTSEITNNSTNKIGYRIPRLPKNDEVDKNTTHVGEYTKNEEANKIRDCQSDLIKRVLKITENTKNAKIDQSAFSKKQEIIKDINKINISEPFEAFTTNYSPKNSMISSESDIDIDYEPKRKVEIKQLLLVDKIKKADHLKFEDSENGMKYSDSQKPDSSLMSIDSETDYVPKRKVSAFKPSKKKIIEDQPKYEDFVFKKNEAKTKKIIEENTNLIDKVFRMSAQAKESKKEEVKSNSEKTVFTLDHNLSTDEEELVRNISTAKNKPKDHDINQPNSIQKTPEPQTKIASIFKIKTRQPETPQRSESDSESDENPEEERKARKLYIGTDLNPALEEQIDKITKISDLTEGQIKYMILRDINYFLDIYSGQCQHSWRHTEYKKFSKKSGNVLYSHAVGMGSYTHEQIMSGVEGLRGIFCRTNNRLDEYIVKVALPEALIKICMRVHQCSKSAAEEYLSKMNLDKKNQLLPR